MIRVERPPHARTFQSLHGVTNKSTQQNFAESPRLSAASIISNSRPERRNEALSHICFIITALFVRPNIRQGCR